MSITSLHSKQYQKQLLSPTIYRLAADRKYSQIGTAVSEQPNDLQWMDNYGSTALHILCQARSATFELVAAVSVCVKVLPCAIGWANSATWTPLHFAVFHQEQNNSTYRVDLILLLIRAFPDAVRLRTTCGYKTKTAFHMACERNADYDVLFAMLQIDASLATATYMSPKQTRTTYSVFDVSSGKQEYSLCQETSLHILYNTGYDSKRKMALLLDAAANGSVCNTINPYYVACSARHLNLLHGISRVEVPRAYAMQILSNIHAKKECMQADENGFLPLHYVLQQQYPSSYYRFILRELLEVAPKAAAIPEPNSGRLPLHMAADADWKWGEGVKDIVFNNPVALVTPDPSSDLLPFQAFNMDTTTLYELLRSAPESLQFRNIKTKAEQ